MLHDDITILCLWDKSQSHAFRSADTNHVIFKACLPYDSKIKGKLSLYDNRDIAPKRETSDRARIRGLAPGQHKNVAAVASRGRQCLI